MKSVNAPDAILLQLDTQRANIELNIANLRKDQEKLKNQIEQYEKWVASAPTREAEWSSLTREYNQLKRHYDNLVAQDLQAKSMLNLERKQKGSQFKIEDFAQTPVKPVKPDFLKIMKIALLLGFGVGGAGALLLEKMITRSLKLPVNRFSILLWYRANFSPFSLKPFKFIGCFLPISTYF